MQNMQETPRTVTPSQQSQAAPAPAAQVKPPKPVPPPEFQAESISKLDSAGLIAILKDGKATTFQKAKACERLEVVGTKDAVPVLAALLTNAELGCYARGGLEAIQDPSADDALRGALSKVKGNLLVGVLNSIGVRKDTKAVLPVSRLMYSTNVDVAQAAATALGHISGPLAAKSLREGLMKTKDPVRASIAASALLCAEGLLAQNRDQALALYDVLTRTNIPKPVRLAAMHGIIAAEVSLNRPR